MAQAKEEQTIEIEQAGDENQPMEVLLDDANAGAVEETKEPAKTQEQAEEQKPEAQPPKKKDDDRGKHTIVRLKSERNQWSEAAARLSMENQTLKAEMENLSRAGMINYEKGLNAEGQLAKWKLEEAIKAEDAKAQAEAQAEVARIAADLRDVEAWKVQNPMQQRQQPQQQQYQQPPSPPPRQLPEEIVNFIEENPWFDERKPEYNEDEHLEAVEYARILEGRLQRQGREGEINSAKYFADIQRHMQEYRNQNNGGQEEQQKEPPPPPPKTTVAGVQRTAPATQQQQRSSQKVALTADEVGLVRKMVAEAAVKYPSTHPDPAKRGRVKTFEDAIKDFARNKANSSASQRL